MEQNACPWCLVFEHSAHALQNRHSALKTMQLRRDGRARQALAARGLLVSRTGTLDALGQRVRARRRQPGRSLHSAAPLAEAYGFEALLELARPEANRLRTERLEARALE